MASKVFYSGDVNVNCGGIFYTLENAKWGYVDAVRVVPCSDAGGPENCFWVEVLTVNFERKESEQKDALQCIGIDCEAYSAMTRSQKLHALIDACIAWGGCDSDSCMIRIGKPDEFYNGREGEFNPELIFRANANLRNIARRALRAGFVC